MPLWSDFEKVKPPWLQTSNAIRILIVCVCVRGTRSFCLNVRKSYAKIIMIIDI